MTFIKINIICIFINIYKHYKDNCTYSPSLADTKGILGKQYTKQPLLPKAKAAVVEKWFGNFQKAIRET
jgi:hypothetical protein